MEMREERGGSFESHQAVVGLGHHSRRWQGQLGYSLCALAKGHPPRRGTAGCGQPPWRWRRRAEHCEECPGWMVRMGSLGDVSTCLALPQLHRADHLIAQKAAEKGAEPWPCRPSPLSAEALGGLSRQGPGAQNRSGRCTHGRHPCRSHGHLSPALPPAARSGPEPKTSPPELPYQSHGAEEDPGEGGQLVQDPQVLQLGLGSGDLSKDTAGAITTSGTPAVSPHQHRGGAGQAAGLTLVPPGWFW